MEKTGAEYRGNETQRAETHQPDVSMLDAPSPSKLKTAESTADKDIEEAEPEKKIIQKDNSAQVNQNINLLEGKRTFGASVMSFFGKDSTFIQLQKKIELLNKAKTKVERDSIKTEVITLGETWLSKHKVAKSDNDQKKLESIEKIVSNLKSEKSASASDVPQKEQEVVSMSDKGTIGEKIISAITGNEGEFTEIEQDFSAHLAKSKGEIKDLKFLFEVVKSAKSLKDKILNYRGKIDKSTTPSDQAKVDTLDKIHSNLGTVTFSYNVNKNILVTANNIDLSKALEGSLFVEKAQMFITFNGDKQVSGEVNGLQLTPNEVHFNSASFTYNDKIGIKDAVSINQPTLKVVKLEKGYQIVATGDLSVSLPKPVEITAKGFVEAKYETDTGNWGVTLSGCNLSGNISEIVNFNIESANYVDGKLTASKATGSLKYNENKPIEGSITDVAVSKEGIDWSAATLKSTIPVNVGNVIKVSEPEATIKGKKDNYLKSFKGGLTLDLGVHSVGAIGASGQVEVTQQESGWSTMVSNGSLSVNILDGLVSLDSKGIQYVDGKLSITATKLKLNSGLEGLPEIVANGADLTYSKEEGFDWKEISLGNLGGFNGFEIFKFQVPDIKWKGKSDNYQLRFENAVAETSMFNGNLTAAGKGTLVWNYKENKPIEFESASLDFTAQSPEDMPSSFLPDGIWPFKFDFSFPIVPAVHAGFGLEFNGGIKIAVAGKMDYNQATGFEFKGTPSMDGKLGFGISIFAGAGIPNIAQLDAYASAGAEAIAKAKLNLNSTATKKDGGKGFEFSKVSGNYDLSASAKANVKAGIRAKALMVFEKKIYEITIGEWNLGEGKKTGKLGLGSQNDVPKTEGDSTGFFAKDIQSPFKAEPSDYLKKLNALTKYVPRTQDISPELSGIDKFLNRNSIIEPVNLEDNFSLARLVIDKVPRRTDAMLSVLNEMESRKRGQWLIRESNRNKRLQEYTEIKSVITDIKARTSELGVKIKVAMVPEDRTEITDFIKEYSSKLVELEEKLIHAKANVNLIENRAEATA